MKKSAFKFLVIAIFSLLIFQANTQVAHALWSADYEYVVNGNNAMIVDYLGLGGDVAIPSTIDGYMVTDIYQYAFRDCKNVTSVTIPSSVIRIGTGAFSWCPNLTSVTIPDSVTDIGFNAFYSCTSLKTVTIPNSVASIRSYTFYNCTNLTSVTIGSSVTSISGYTFDWCTSLTEAKFLGNAPDLGSYVFGHCSSGFKAYYLPGATGFTNPWHGYSTEPFEEETYAVTYEGNGNIGGTAPTDNETYLADEEVTVLGNTGLLAKIGYTFSGWNTEADGTGISYAAGDTFNMGTDDITLYAKWTVNKYTVKFNSNGGSAVTNQAVNYKCKATKPANPTKTGYTFGGWYKDAALKKTYNFNTSIVGNTTLYAKWTVNKYTVKFNSNGGSAVTNQTVNYKCKATKPANPTKTGYTFGGWYKDAALKETYNFNTSIVGNTTLYAKWTVNKYTVKFNSNGGSAVTNQAVNYKCKATKPANPTKTGYTFGGWYKDAALKKAYNFNTAIVGNTTLYAKWT